MITSFKIFENVVSDFKYKLGEWLNLNKPDQWNGPEGWSGRHKLYRVDYSYYNRALGSYGLALSYHPGRSDSFYIFYINVGNVKDNKQKELEVKTKIKITTSLGKFAPHLQTNKQNDAMLMYDFLTLTLNKYSYFKKIQSKGFDFYINISDFDKIMTDLQDFDLYKNSKKFNI